MNIYFEGRTKTYNGKTVFENISGRINEKDRIGLIGANGVGKTTLAKIISVLIYDDVSINIMHQDKIALIGPNGSGKTTFLKILCGWDDSYEGMVWVNPSVKIGNFAQELDSLNDDAVLFDEVSSMSSSVEETRLLLACLLFKGNDV